MTFPRPVRRLLLVHAHPDDESIGTGATMAKYAAEGAQVTLVTCTLGELGEIIPAGLAHLAADRDDRLGGYRTGELAAACAALGVTDHRFLGGAGRWRDSGMMGTPGNDAPGLLLAGRPGRGRSRPPRGDPRGPPAGAGQLRLRRRLRSSRSHPGAPGGPARLPARGRDAVAGGQVLRHGQARLAAGDGRDRRHPVPDGQAGRDARARDADHVAGRRPLRAVQPGAPAAAGRECYTLLAGGPDGRAPGPEHDLFAGTP